jgi:hypothetical protein
MKAHKILELKSPPYPPGTSGAQVMPFPAELRPIQPLQRCILLDAETAAAFALERLDEVDGAELFRLTGRSTMPDGAPARGLRIGWRRYPSGTFAMQRAVFHALVYLEVDTAGMETRLRSIAADGFGDAKEEAARRQRAPVTVAAPASSTDGELAPPDGPPVSPTSATIPAPALDADAPPASGVVPSTST